MPDNFIRVRNSSLNDYFCADKRTISTKVGLPKEFKVEKVQSLEISKLRNVYVGKSLSPESCL